MLRPGQVLDPEHRRQVLLDFAETVDAVGGRYRTAEDVGTSDADMAVIAERTSHVTGLAVESGGSGDPSPWTALGVESALRVACERVWGSSSLEGRRIAVIGLGRVGGHLARGLADRRRRAAGGGHRPGQARARPRARRGMDRSRHGAARRRRRPRPLRARRHPGRPLRSRLALPGHRGGRQQPARLRSVADLLAARDILWAPDFVANAGGIVNIAIELEPGGYVPERAEPAVRAIGDTMRRILDDAAAIGATPLTAAMELARRRLAEAELA
jgi:leucine dehydrogenase